MANIANLVSSQVASLLLSADQGIGAQMAELSAESGVGAVAIAASQILEQSAPPPDYAAADRFPAIYITCENLANLQTEKGRRFSGKARMTIECRTSQDRLDGLDARIRLLADAVAETLYQSRGKWTESMFFGGRYEVQFGAVKRGGKNLMQSARITFDVDVSSN